jgi:hypothetical protein
MVTETGTKPNGGHMRTNCANGEARTYSTFACALAAGVCYAPFRAF